MTDSVVAIIPARSGSKGVPNKNVARLGGFPLLAFSIVAAKLTPGIERVILSTDSEAYQQIGRQFGAETPFLRPPELALDHSSDRDFFLHAMRWFNDHEGGTPEFWLHLRPTTPLRDPSVISAALRTILSHPQATSLRSGHQAAESPFKWFQLDEDGYFKGIRPDDPRPEYYNLPRQHFPTVYIPDGYIDIVRATHVLNSDSLHGDRMVGFESPSCVEMDSDDDFQRLEYNLEHNGSVLLEFMKQNHHESCRD